MILYIFSLLMLAKRLNIDNILFRFSWWITVGVRRCQCQLWGQDRQIWGVWHPAHSDASWITRLASISLTIHPLWWTVYKTPNQLSFSTVSTRPYYFSLMAFSDRFCLSISKTDERVIFGQKAVFTKTEKKKNIWTILYMYMTDVRRWRTDGAREEVDC